jgi:polar amino acid transport system substrate-binding protein
MESLMYQIALCILVFSCNVFSCNLTVRLEQYTPQGEKLSDKSWAGIDYQLTEKLLSTVGCSFKIIEMPWARSLEALAFGEIDMMLNVTKTVEREKDYYFVGPFRTESIVLATKENSKITLNKMEDILSFDKPIAVQRKGFYGETIKRFIDNPRNKAHFIQVTDNESKIALLRLGRIAGFLEEKSNLVMGNSATPRFEGIWYDPLIIHQSPIYYAFSKKSVDSVLLKKLNTAFNNIK